MINHVDQRLMCSAIPLGTGVNLRMMMLMIPRSDNLDLISLAVH